MKFQPQSNRPSVAVVVSAFNEEACIQLLVDQLLLLFADEVKYEFSCYLVDNGSTDCTWRLIQEACYADSRFRGIRLSRNFGTDGGLTAGLSYVQEDACVFMAADLQDPPAFAGTFLREWEKGYENVFAVISERHGTGWLRRLNSQFFYALVSVLSEETQPRNVSDFRLLDRRAYTVLRNMPERSRYLRGLSAWMGFASRGVPLSRPPRVAGKSKASTGEVLRVATRVILSNSTKPLRLITLVGLASMAGSMLLIGLLLVLWILNGVPFAGFGSLVSLNLLTFGALAFMIGIVAEYVGLIYAETRGRPNFIVSEATFQDMQ